MECLGLIVGFDKVLGVGCQGETACLYRGFIGATAKPGF